MALAVEYLAMVVIGGLASPAGAVAGAVFVSCLPAVLERYAAVLPGLAPAGAEGISPAVAAKFAFGAAIVALLLLEPGGAAAIGGRLRRTHAGRALHSPVVVEPNPIHPSHSRRSTCRGCPHRPTPCRAPAPYWSPRSPSYCSAAGCSTKADDTTQAAAGRAGNRPGRHRPGDQARRADRPDRALRRRRQVAPNRDASSSGTRRTPQGGVCDRKVEFVVKDHGYNAQNAVTAYAQIKDEVLALDELLGSPMIAGLLPDLEADQMLTMAASWSSSLLSQPVRRDHRQHVRRRDDQRHPLADREQGPGQGRQDRPHLPRGRLRRERRRRAAGPPPRSSAWNSSSTRSSPPTPTSPARSPPCEGDGRRLRPPDHHPRADRLGGRGRGGVRVRRHLPRLQPLVQRRAAPPARPRPRWRSGCW